MFPPPPPMAYLTLSIQLQTSFNKYLDVLDVLKRLSTYFMFKNISLVYEKELFLIWEFQQFIGCIYIMETVLAV